LAVSSKNILCILYLKDDIFNLLVDYLVFKALVARKYMSVVAFGEASEFPAPFFRSRLIDTESMLPTVLAYF